MMKLAGFFLVCVCVCSKSIAQTYQVFGFIPTPTFGTISYTEQANGSELKSAGTNFYFNLYGEMFDGRGYYDFDASYLGSLVSGLFTKKNLFIDGTYASLCIAPNIIPKSRFMNIVAGGRVGYDQVRYQDKSLAFVSTGIMAGFPVGTGNGFTLHPKCFVERSFNFDNGLRGWAVRPSIVWTLQHLFDVGSLNGLTLETGYTWRSLASLEKGGFNPFETTSWYARLGISMSIGKDE